MRKIHCKDKAFVLSLIGLSIGVGACIVLYTTFFYALMNNYQLTIYVNKFSEAIPELFFIPTVMILNIYGLIYFFRLKLTKKI